MPGDTEASASVEQSGAAKAKATAVSAIDLVTKIGGAVGAYLGVAAILVWPPFSGLPDVRVDVAASRVNSPGSDRAADEYICLVNKGDEAGLLSWTLRDAEGDVNVLPDITLDSGQSIRVHPGRGTNSETDVYGDEGTPSWNNTGDTIALLDDAGNEIDSRTYGQSSESSTVSCGSP